MHLQIVPLIYSPISTLLVNRVTSGFDEEFPY